MVSSTRDTIFVKAHRRGKPITINTPLSKMKSVFKQRKERKEKKRKNFKNFILKKRI